MWRSGMMCGFVYSSWEPQAGGCSPARFPFPCIYRVKSRCCRPLQDLMQDWIGNDRRLYGSYAQICAPFPRRAEVGFAVWEFRDLGSGVKVMDRRPGCPPHPPSPPSIFLDCAAPGANVVNRSFWERGGWSKSNEQFPSLEAQAQAQTRMLPCLERVAMSSSEQ
ncbi:hypothetical protein N431DRAFT_437814 [Stipitochalara longipes BDJ]|nr:hypothetical protein N431DRAFT_437814 [Stipitochalara longipes BDJ]